MFLEQKGGSPESPGYDQSSPQPHRSPYNDIDEGYPAEQTQRGRQPAMSPNVRSPASTHAPGKSNAGISASVQKTLKGQVSELELRNKTLTEELR